MAKKIANDVKTKTDDIRKRLAEIDELLGIEDELSGTENGSSSKKGVSSPKTAGKKPASVSVAKKPEKTPEKKTGENASASKAGKTTKKPAAPAKKVDDKNPVAPSAEEKPAKKTGESGKPAKKPAAPAKKVDDKTPVVPAKKKPVKKIKTGGKGDVEETSSATRPTPEVDKIYTDAWQRLANKQNGIDSDDLDYELSAHNLEDKRKEVISRIAGVISQREQALREQGRASRISRHLEEVKRKDEEAQERRRAEIVAARNQRHLDRVRLVDEARARHAAAHSFEERDESETVDESVSVAEGEPIEVRVPIEGAREEHVHDAEEVGDEMPYEGDEMPDEAPIETRRIENPIFGHLDCDIVKTKNSDFTDLNYKKSNFFYKGKTKKAIKAFEESETEDETLKIVIAKGENGYPDLWVFRPNLVPEGEVVNLDDLTGQDSSELKKKSGKPAYFYKVKGVGVEKYNKNGKNIYAITVYDPEGGKDKRIIVKDVDSKLGRLWLATTRKKLKKNGFTEAFNGYTMPTQERETIRRVSNDLTSLTKREKHAKGGFVKSPAIVKMVAVIGLALLLTLASPAPGEAEYAEFLNAAPTVSVQITNNHIDEFLAGGSEISARSEVNNTLFNYEMKSDGSYIISPNKIAGLVNSKIESTAESEIKPGIANWSYSAIFGGLDYRQPIIAGAAGALGARVAEELHAHGISSDSFKDENGSMKVIYGNGSTDRDSFKTYLTGIGYSSDDAETYVMAYETLYNQEFKTLETEAGSSEVKPAPKPPVTDPDVDQMEDGNQIYLNNENLINVVSTIVGVPASDLTVESINIGNDGTNYVNTLSVSSGEKLYTLTFNSDYQATSSREFYTALENAQKVNKVTIKENASVKEIYNKFGVKELYADGLIKAISEKVLTEQNAKVKNVYFNFDESSTKVDGKISRGGDLIVVAENGTVFTYRAVDVSTKKNVPLSEKVIACFTLGQFDMYVSGISNPNDYIVSSESEVELKGTMLNQAGTYVEVETDAPETTQETANAKNAERERTL